MVVEAFIGPGYELPVKPFLADAGLVAGCQKDCLAIRAEGEEDAADALKNATIHAMVHNSTTAI